MGRIRDLERGISYLLVNCGCEQCHNMKEDYEKTAL